MTTLQATGVATSPAVKVAGAWIVLPSFFLITGGSLMWWQAWTYCAIILIPATIFIAHMARHDPDFIARRSKLREKERAQRRVIDWGWLPTLGAFVIPGLDFRFGWSEPPVAAVIAATAISLAAYLGILRVFSENRWAGRTIETYADQRVITTGAYAIVRHPMYATSLVLYLATPVALGSWWAVVPALGFIPVLVFRIRYEEETLVRDLPGYTEYRQKVRHRLLPLVW